MKPGYKIQNLREVRRVTEWRDGCVYQTQVVGYAWVDDGLEPTNGETLYGSISTHELIRRNYATSRIVEKTVPSVEEER